MITANFLSTDNLLDGLLSSSCASHLNMLHFTLFLTQDIAWDIIEALDRGLSVREVATLFDRGERQIRVIRERLAELRAADAEPKNAD